MVSRFSFALLAMSAGVLAACSGHVAENDVAASIAANAAAADHVAWETSASTPERIFERWRMEKRDDKEVCQALNARSSDELTLFEDEIKKQKNDMLVADCRQQLVTKIENYWAMQTNKAKHLSMDFTLPSVKTTIDFRDGLQIVNAGLKPKQVLLTFDDGPHATNTDIVLRSLRKTNVKAIFFQMGRNVKRLPEITQRIAADGHGVGSHSMTHKCLAFTEVCAKNNGGKMPTYAESVSEMFGGHAEVFKALGWVDPFFRFPYGASSPELKKVAADRGVGEFFWSIDSNDWRNQTPDDVVNLVMKDLAKNGSRGVVLMHDIQRRTAVALPILLRRLYDEGYSAVILRPSNEQSRFHSKMAGPEMVKPVIPAFGMPSISPSFHVPRL